MYKLKSWFEYGVLSGFSESYFRKLTEVYEVKIVSLVIGNYGLINRMDFHVEGEKENMEKFVKVLNSLA